MSSMYDRNGHVLHVGDYVDTEEGVCRVERACSDGMIVAQSARRGTHGGFYSDDVEFEATADDYAAATLDYLGRVLHDGDAVRAYDKDWRIERVDGEVLYLHPLSDDEHACTSLALDVAKVDA